jgi:hypothetical protein
MVSLVLPLMGEILKAPPETETRLLSLSKGFQSASDNREASDTVDGDVIFWLTRLPKVVAYHCVPMPGGLKDATVLLVVLKAVEVEVLNDAIELSTLLKLVEVDVLNEATELLTLLVALLKPVDVEVLNEATALSVLLKAVEVEVDNEATCGFSTVTHVPAPWFTFATVQFCTCNSLPTLIVRMSPTVSAVIDAA